MPFQKNNSLGAKKILSRALGKQVIGFRGYEGQKEKLKQIPNWQEKLRCCVDQMIKEHGK